MLTTHFCDGFYYKTAAQNHMFVFSI